MMWENKTECKMTFRNEEPHVNMSFPRVRGDVPQVFSTSTSLSTFSPRARGCSAVYEAIGKGVIVFPACAGMFRPAPPPNQSGKRFPRVRGDVPQRVAG